MLRLIISAPRVHLSLTISSSFAPDVGRAPPVVMLMMTSQRSLIIFAYCLK